MFALISSRSGSQSAMLLRWALQGHHGPPVLPCQQNISKTVGARALKIGELIGSDE